MPKTSNYKTLKKYWYTCNAVLATKTKLFKSFCAVMSLPALFESHHPWLDNAITSANENEICVHAYVYVYVSLCHFQVNQWW